MTPKHLIVSALSVLFLAVALAEAYRGVGLALQNFFAPTTTTWLAALIVNAFGAIVFWIYFSRTSRNSRSGSATDTTTNGKPYTQGIWPWLPALIIVGGALVLGVCSSFMVGSTEQGESQSISISAIPPVQLVYIFIVPIVEEYFFRFGIGTHLRRYAGVLWGSYFSAMLFSVVHSFPTVERLIDGQIGLLLGPFLLGLICEALFGYVRRLGPAIAFHMACNGTVVLFSLVDPRWLDWLRVLYSSVDS